jgi:hypothetical protein
MNISALVYIGVFLILVSIAVNIYLQWDRIKLIWKQEMKDKKFEKDVKKELNKIDKNISKEKESKSSDKKTESSDKKTESKSEDSKPKTEKIPVKIDTTDIDKEIEKLNQELKKLEKDIKIEEQKAGKPAAPPAPEPPKKLIDPGPEIPKSLTSPVESTKEKSKPVQPPQSTPTKNPDYREVYLVRSNLFKKGEAQNVCRALFNSEVATKEQLVEASNSGADWCNYGWASDNNAYYPLQKDTDNATCRGNKGLNGGELTNAENLKLGINCYGIKPNEINYNSLEKIHNTDKFNESEKTLLETYRKQLNSGAIKLEPYNPNQWSRYSFKNDTIKINDNTIVTTTKTDKSKDPQSIKTEKTKVDSIITTPAKK